MDILELRKNISNINNLLEEKEKNLCKSSLYHFDKNVLGYSLMTEKPHLELCKFTQKGKKLLILMPRGSFKTSVVTVGYCLWRIVRNPNIRILIDSETIGRSKKFLSELKTHIESNEKFKKLFGDLKGKETWSKTEITVSTRTKNLKEPTVAIAGIDTPAVGLHFDLIIADDLHSEKNVTTKDQIDQVIEHYKLLTSILEPDGKMVVIGTRWHDSDLYGYLLEEEKDTFKYMRKQAIDDDGNLLMPDRLNMKFLDRAKKTMGSYLFSCQYQNEAISQADAKFKREDFQYYKPEDLPERLNVFMSIDPAISIRAAADFSAIVVIGVDEMFNVYILDIFRGKVEPRDLINQTFTMVDRWNPRLVGVETVSFQDILRTNLIEEQKIRGKYLPLYPLKRNTRESKDDRILLLQPKYQTHSIFHPLNHTHTLDLENELMRFPKGKHDDIIDALADAVSISNPTRKKRDKKKQIYKPISKITGW